MNIKMAITSILTGLGVVASLPATAAPTCPIDGVGVAGDFREHSGLRKIDAQNFALARVDTPDSGLTAGAPLKPGNVTPDLALESFPPSILPGLAFPLNSAFSFFSATNSDNDDWTPQAMGGARFEGKDYLVVPWYHHSYGSRISLIKRELMQPGVKSYRNVLLVEPSGNSFKLVDVHAGGTAWVGKYLYVADTRYGFRVFDMERIREVSDDASCAGKIGLDAGTGKYCAFGSRYVAPQSFRYMQDKAADPSCAVSFSFVARDAYDPNTLISGENRRHKLEKTSAQFGRLFRWHLNPDGTLEPKAVEAFYMGNDNVQGAISVRAPGANGPLYLMNSTRYDGAVISGQVGQASAVVKQPQWIRMPQGLYVSEGGELWANTERSLGKQDQRNKFLLVNIRSNPFPFTAH